MRLLLSMLCSLSLAACGGSSQPANPPPPASCPPGQTFDGRSCVVQPLPPATPPTADPNMPAPDAGPGPVAPAGPNAKPLDPAAAAVATQALGALAAESAPGAKPVGPALAGEFGTGQTLEAVLQFEAGRCYTVVGASAPTVQNLDIELVPVTPLPGVAPVVAVDQSTGPTAVVGAKPNCFKAMFPGGMKIVLRVSAGQGIAAAQLYVK